MAADLDRSLHIVERFKDAKVLVVGDIMVDEYVWGSVERISPEAPVPVVSVEDDTLILGGAANVVNNIHSLGGSATISGVVGDDEVGESVSVMLIRRGLENEGLIKDFTRRTTLKTRVIAHNQQIVRIDREDRRDISREVTQRMVRYLEAKIPEVDAVVISDYGKGVLTRELIETIVALVRKHEKICSVDPKINHFNLYQGATVITPNHNEASQAVGQKIASVEDVRDVAGKLREMVGCKNVLVTYGARGMCLLEENDDFLHINTVAKKVFDVTGAGDTVISALTLALAAGATLPEAARLSNIAAGIVVREFGTATVDQATLLSEVQKGVV